jgi:hypothetical protein
MSFESGFDEKIDVIDLIINVLKDHENKLDELVSRLEGAEVLREPPTDTKEEEIYSLEEPTPRPVKRAPSMGVGVKAKLRSWTEFRERSEGAELVAFDVDGGCFKVSAVAGGVLYSFQEEIPRMEIRYSKANENARIDTIDINKAELMLAALRGQLNCGLVLEKRNVETETPNGNRVHKVVYDIDPSTARNWLAYQLSVEDDSILNGEISV